VNIFLADLQNSYYRYLRNSVPIGMGYVHANLHKMFGADVKIHQFRKFEEMHEAAKTIRPDLAAFGSYSWNTSLTARTATWLKRKFPEVVIAMGGPDVSPVVSRVAGDMAASPDIDFFMPNEAEAPMGHLVRAMLGARRSRDLKGSDDILGCLSLDPSGKVHGRVMDRFDGDINDIPSPYLDGFMDRFLADIDYLPIVQTARGCPYRCTFCVSGKDTWVKVKPFHMDRVKAEIDYVAAKATARYLRLADENFGIQPRDLEIAEYIMAMRARTGFPTAVSIYTDKHPTERVKEINRLMRDCLPFCISFQSVDADVLKNIKRINLKEKEIERAVGFARENNLTLVTELIFPLPGETLTSFLKGVDRLIDHRFESVIINPLRLLKGTEMDLPEDRRAHGYVSRYYMSDNGYTGHPEMVNVEVDELVVATNTLSEEEYYRITGLVFLIEFGYFHGMFKELLFLMSSHGVPASELLYRVSVDAVLCPVLSGYAGRFAARVKAMMRETPEAVHAYVTDRMKFDPSSVSGFAQIKDELSIELLMSGKLPAAADEMASMAKTLHAERGGADPAGLAEELAVIRRVLVDCYISIDRRVPRDVVVESPYDLSAWRLNNYRGRLAEYRRDRPQAATLRIANYAVYEAIWNNGEETVLNKFKKNFLTINSANRRRVLVTSPAGAANDAAAPAALASD